MRLSRGASRCPVAAGAGGADLYADRRSLLQGPERALYGIFFDTDKAELKPESEPTLKEIAVLVKAN